MSRNLFLFYILRIVQCSFVIIPTLVIFLEDNGLDIADVLFLKAVLSAVVVIFEVPSGYFADRFGRKTVVLFGMYAWTVSTAVYCIAESFVGFLFAEILFGVALSMISGADTALLYDTLKAQERIEEYPKHEGRLSGVMGFSEALGGLIGAFLASYYLRAPFYLQFVLQLIGIVSAHLLVEPPREKTVGAEHPLQTLLVVTKESLIQNKKLAWLFYHGTIAGAATFLIVWFSQKYMSGIGLPLAYFGVAWAVFHIVLGLSSLQARRVESLLGAEKTFLMLSLLIFFSYIGLGLFDHISALIFVALLYVARGVRNPLMKTYINNQISSDTRATVLSVYSFLFRIEWIVYGPFIGWIADLYSLSVAFFLSSLFLGGACLFTWWMMKMRGSLST